MAEAEGLRLHLSSHSSTGYKGVDKLGSRFRVRHKGGKKVRSVGIFDTAVEAAVAYARVVGEPVAKKKRVRYESHSTNATHRAVQLSMLSHRRACGREQLGQ